MKTKKLTLRMETLDDRNMPSASPLGEIAAPAQEPTAGSGSLSYNFGGIESGVSVYPDISSELKSVIGQVDSSADVAEQGDLTTPQTSERSTGSTDSDAAGAYFTIGF